MRTLFFLLISSTLAGGQSDSWKNVYTESAWEQRDTWQKPGELINKLGIRRGSSVADVGCHEGYMSFKLSEVVGPLGKVYAVDVDQAKLNKLREHMERRKTSNIAPVKGDYDDPKLPLSSLDAVIILDSYHEMDDHEKILQSIKAALKTGGRLVICEPIADSRRGASRSDQEGRHELGMNYAIEDLVKAGFSIREKKDPFADREKIKSDQM